MLHLLDVYTTVHEENCYEEHKEIFKAEHLLTFGLGIPVGCHASFRICRRAVRHR